GPTAVANDVEVELHTLHIRNVVRVVVDAAEAITDRERGKHRGWLSTVDGGEHVLNPNLRVAVDPYRAVHAVGGFLAVLINAVQRVENRGHHCHRAEPRVVEDLVMKFFRGRSTMDV